MCKLTAGRAGGDDGVVSLFVRPRLRTGNDLPGVVSSAPLRRTGAPAAAAAAVVDGLDFDVERCGVFE